MCAWAVLPAQATPYSDFDAGVAAGNQRRCDIAVARMTSALAAPDLLPSLKLPARMVRARCRMHDKDYASALTDLDAALALSPDNYDAHLYRGDTRFDLGRIAGAEADFDALVRIRPDLGNGHVTLGRFYASQKRYDEAVAEFTTLIAINPPSGYSLRSHAYMLKGDFARALADADYIVGNVPKYSYGYMTREIIYEAQGDLPHALSDIEKAIDVSSDDDADMERQKGIVLWKAGRFSDAADALRRAIKLNPKDGYSVMWLDLSRLADNEPDRDLTTNAAAVDAAVWPAPLLAVYTAQATPEAALKTAAAAVGPGDLERNICEGDFYVGAWNVFHGSKDAGRALLEQAVTACPNDYGEGQAAAAALKRMP